MDEAFKYVQRIVSGGATHFKVDDTTPANGLIQRDGQFIVQRDGQYIVNQRP